MTVASAFKLYRVMAYIVGVMLIVVFVSIPFDSVERVVGLFHGVLYLIYLATVVNLMIRARLGLWPFVAMVVAGWIPFLAFIVERRIARRLAPELASS